MFSLQALGAVAQLERALIAERTKAGLRSARLRGRVGGNPGLHARDPEAVRKARAARDATHLSTVLAHLDEWLPTVRQMPPGQPWGDVVRVLNRTGAMSWTSELLRRTVRRLAAEKVVEPERLDPWTRKPAADRLVVVVAGIASAAPDRTLQQIASQLEGMRERTARRNAGACLLSPAPAAAGAAPRPARRPLPSPCHRKPWLNVGGAYRPPVPVSAVSPPQHTGLPPAAPMPPLAVRARAWRRHAYGQTSPARRLPARQQQRRVLSRAL
jgi:hypothetical protein